MLELPCARRLSPDAVGAAGSPGAVLTVPLLSANPDFCPKRLQLRVPEPRSLVCWACLCQTWMQSCRGLVVLPHGELVSHLWL